MPIGRVACQSRHFKPEHDDADTPKTDFGDQALESFSIRCAGAGLSKIVVDHDNAIDRPSQGESALSQRILAVSALRVLQNLTQRRLTHIKIGHPRQVRGSHFLMSFTVHSHWRCPSLCDVRTAGSVDRIRLAKIVLTSFR